MVRVICCLLIALPSQLRAIPSAETVRTWTTFHHDSATVFNSDIGWIQALPDGGWIEVRQGHWDNGPVPALIRRFDSFGNALWSESHPNLRTVFRFTLLADGGILMGGEPISGSESWWGKYNGDSTLHWVQTGLSPISVDYQPAVCPSADNGFLVADEDQVLTKYDIYGDIEWSAPLQLSGADGVCLCESDGRIIVVGLSGGPFQIFDSNGQVLSNGVLPNLNQGALEPWWYLCCPGDAGSFYIAGSVGIDQQTDCENAAPGLCKVSADGAIVWGNVLNYDTGSLPSCFSQRLPMEIARSENAGVILLIEVGAYDSNLPDYCPVPLRLVAKKISSDGAPQWEITTDFSDIMNWESWGDYGGNSFWNWGGENGVWGGPKEGQLAVDGAIFFICPRMEQNCWGNIKEGSLILTRLSSEGAISRHVPMRNHKVGQANTVRAEVFEMLPGMSMTLSYQVGADAFTTIPMPAVPGLNMYEGEIPADDCVGDSIRYYISLLNGIDEVVERIGTEEIPLRSLPKWVAHNSQRGYYSLIQDSWAFENTSLFNVWSEAWSSNMDYMEKAECGEGSSDVYFPSISVAAEAFGSDDVYYTVGSGDEQAHIMRPGFILWYLTTRHCWKGSCFGMVTTSALYFTGARSVSTDFPGFNEVWDIPSSSSASRRKVNVDMATQWSSEVIANSEFLSPNMVLNQLVQRIQNLESALLELGLFGAEMVDGNLFRHAVLPVEIAQETDSTWKVFCYDPNKAPLTEIIFITTDNDGEGSWSAPVYAESQARSPGKLSLFNPLFLEGDLSLYLTSGSRTCAPTAYALSIESPAYHVWTPAGTFGYDEFGYGGFFGLEYAEPLVHITGYPSKPYGWEVASDAYQVSVFPDMNDLGASTGPSRMTIRSDCQTFYATRDTLDNAQWWTNIYLFDPVSKSLALTTWDDASGHVFSTGIIEHTIQSETAVELGGIEIAYEDTLTVAKPADEAVITNDGNVKTVTLRVTAILNGEGSIFYHDSLAIPDSSLTSFYMPSATGADSLEVRYDLDMDGTPDSTIFLENQFVVHCDSLAPALPPDSLTVFLLDSNQLVLRWSPVTLDTDSLPIIVDHYSVHGSSSLDFSDTLYWAETNNTTVTDTTSVQAQNALYFRVSASRCP